MAITNQVTYATKYGTRQKKIKSSSDLGKPIKAKVKTHAHQRRSQ